MALLHARTGFPRPNLPLTCRAVSTSGLLLLTIIPPPSVIIAGAAVIPVLPVTTTSPRLHLLRQLCEKELLSLPSAALVASSIYPPTLPVTNIEISATLNYLLTFSLITEQHTPLSAKCYSGLAYRVSSYLSLALL